MQNPLTAASEADDRKRILDLFPALAAHPGFPVMALRGYLERCPERFFNQRIYAQMLDWLTRRDGNQQNDLRKYLVGIDAQISAALLFLRQINAEDWHDRHLAEGDEYDTLRFIDKVLHPVYLRLAEAILAPLIRPVAHFSRLDRGKQTDGLDVFNLVQELAETPMVECVAAYNHIVRNGIGHGGITYKERDIEYRDKKGNTEILDVVSVVRLCDDMIDTCNALAAAIKVFLIRSFRNGYQLPRELLVEELMEETRSPLWVIEGCIASTLADSPRLIIYARPNSRDVLKILWSSMQSAILAESLAPGYTRYFLSLRTPMAWPGWAAFDGNALRQIRETGATEVHEYAGAMEKNGFFYVPHPALPRLLGKLESLVQICRLHWPIMLRQIRANLQMPNIVSRDAKTHRNQWGYVLNGGVVISKLQNETAAQIIRAHKLRIVRAAAKQARESKSWCDITRYLPLGYARISVFSQDFRCRRLKGFGLGPELICVLQLNRLHRIRVPDIIDSTVESSGNWRIAWNRAWIDAGGCLKVEKGRPLPSKT